MNTYVFETSWEVCNKVGGIYTVIKSKVELMTEHYPNYFFIGPYFKSQAQLELTPCDPPSFLKHAFDALKQHGITCYFGRWNIKGNPYTILIDAGKLWEWRNGLKGDYFKNFQIDSLGAGYDYEEPFVWSHAVYLLMEQIERALDGYRNSIIAHFHEWMTAFPVLLIKKNKLPVATVFTTHATMLGRSMCGTGFDLYSNLDRIDPGTEAYKHGVQAKYLTERQCAQYADVFTTVSEITSIEAEKILGRKADVILLNGLDVSKFPNFEEISIRHRQSRKNLRDFISYYFFPYYTFDLSHNLLFYIVGRYEYTNKGIDVMIKALGKLNERMKKEVEQRTITVFFWIPAGVTSIRKDLLENKVHFRRILDEIVQRREDVDMNMITQIVTGAKFSVEEIFGHDFEEKIKKIALAFKRDGTPPLCTHELQDEAHDDIINGFKAAGLLNRKEDKVKVIFYPTYINSADGLANLDYYEAMAGCHLGIFPSYYEPYGYTPLESAANGVPAITTDLAGFGRFIQGKLAHKPDDGIFVLKRQNRNYDDIVNDFTDMLLQYANRRSWQRVENKINAKRVSTAADWRVLVNNYYSAHALAIERMKKRT